MPKPFACFIRVVIIPVSFWLYLLRLGATGFGGPIALLAKMQQHWVERTALVSAEKFQSAVAMAQLTPGPLAGQVAMTVAYWQAKTLWQRLWYPLAAILALSLPAFVLVVAVALLGLQNSQLWQNTLRFLAGPILVLIAHSAFRLAKTTLAHAQALSLPKRFNFGVLLASFCLYLWPLWPVPVTFVLSAGLLLLLGGQRNGVLACVAENAQIKPPVAPLVSLGAFMLLLLAVPLGASVPFALLWLLFCARSALLVYGSGLTLVPFLYPGMVSNYHWVSHQQFLDGVTLAMLTPGPMVIAVAYWGALKAGFLGACVGLVGVFLPAYLMVQVFTPWLDQWTHWPRVQIGVVGVTLAASGAIAGSVWQMLWQTPNTALNWALGLLVLVWLFIRRF